MATLTASCSCRFRKVSSQTIAKSRSFTVPFNGIRGYRAAGFHIIVHLIVIRKEVISTRPELAEELCTAFDRAKEQAYRTLQNERLTSLPLMRSYLDETVSLFGADPWSYGLERNWKELDQFLTHAHYQGLTNNKLNPQELFDNTARDYRFQAKLV